MIIKVNCTSKNINKLILFIENMELSLLIAKILFILFLVIGLRGIFEKKYYQKIIKDTFKNTSVTLLFGIIVFIVSFFVITIIMFGVVGK